jgi:hypothetical protein
LIQNRYDRHHNYHERLAIIAGEFRSTPTQLIPDEAPGFFMQSAYTHRSSPITSLPPARQANIFPDPKQQPIIMSKSLLWLSLNINPGGTYIPFIPFPVHKAMPADTA